ncbi:Ankyrin repeat-containing domain protein [Elaphomyces granulatus]
MPLSNLPTEILLYIAAYLDDAEVNAFCRTNSEVHDLLNAILYRRDPANPLLWGIKNGVKGTVQRAVDVVSRHWYQIPDAYNIALQAAVGQGKADLVKLLLKVDGINPNFGAHSKSVLAPELGQSDVVELHLDTDIRDQPFASPLYYACKWGYVSIVKQLLSREDVDVNALAFDGSTPLLIACWGGLVGVVNLLLAKDGIDVNAYNKYGETPLIMAMTRESVPIVKSLLARDDCDPTMATSLGFNVLHKSVCLGDVAIVKSLLDHPNVDPNAENDFSRTALMEACREEHLDMDHMVRFLLDIEGIDVNRRDYVGHTAFCMAICRRKHRIASLLLTRDDMDLNLPDYFGRTPLYWACKIESISLVDLLLGQDGIDPNARETSSGYTPLARACLNYNMPIVTSLLSHPDTDPNTVDKNGASILDLVRADWRDWDRAEFESLLLRAGAR